MRLKFDPLGIWCVARGSRGELHELEVALRVWARGCNSEVRGRALYRWERDGLHMLTGAVLASPPLLRNHPPPRTHERQTQELVGAVSALPVGVYIAMNARLFNPFRCRKNRDRRMFEEV